MLIIPQFFKKPQLWFKFPYYPEYAYYPETCDLTNTHHLQTLELYNFLKSVLLWYKIFVLKTEQKKLDKVFLYWGCSNKSDKVYALRNSFLLKQTDKY